MRKTPGRPGTTRLGGFPLRAALSAVLALAFLGAVLGCSSALSADPSFDCAKASTAVEKLICGNPALARLDSDMAARYHAALESNPERRTEIRDGQRIWAGARSKTCIGRRDSVQCLIGLYKERISYLSFLSQGGGASGGRSGAFTLSQVPGTYLHEEEGYRMLFSVTVSGSLASLHAESLTPGGRSCEFEGKASSTQLEATLSDGSPVAFRDNFGDGVMQVSFFRSGARLVNFGTKDDYNARPDAYCGMNGWFKTGAELSKTN